MKRMNRALFVLAFAFMMTSCYVQTHVVGAGAQGNTKVSKWNHYVLGGLAPIDVSQPEVMANGVKDYTVTTQHSFVNGLVNAITFGIYSPTTTTVKY